MGEVIYALCAVTSLLCAGLLFRGYRAQRSALLFWSALCFLGLTAGSALLFVDLVVVPERDLSVFRAGISALSVGVLAIALVWTSRAA